MITVRLSTKETFVVPDKYEVSMETVNADDDIKNDSIKIKCLVVKDNSNEPVKRRCYPLSHVVAFGDTIGVLP